MQNFKRPTHKSQPRQSLDGMVKPSALKGWTSSSQQINGAKGRSTLSSTKPSDQGLNSGIAATSTLSRFSSYTPSANEAEVEEPHKKRRLHLPRFKSKYVLRTAIILVVLCLGLTGFLFGKGYFKLHSVFKGGAKSATALQANADPKLLKGEGDGRVNILVLGKGGPGHDGPDLTDTLLVASIDPIAKEAVLLSIPRDMWVKVPGYGQMKINSAYANAKYAAQYKGKSDADAEKAGLDTIQQQITDTMGIPIHYRVMVDFEAFRQAIDTVGGVTIDVKTQLYDPSVAWENNHNPVIAAVGLQTMNGKKALLYSRSRHGSARGDFDRTERQREVILALKDKVLSAGTFSNPVKISQLIDAFGNHIQTDLSLSDMLRLYSIGKNIPSAKITSLGLADPPNDYVTTGAQNGQSIVLPRAGLFDYSEIQNYVRNTLRDGYLKSENANVVVLNGTDTAGLATTKANLLKSYGYNVTLVGDAPTKDYQNTHIIDLTNGVKKYTKTYLEKRLNLKAETKLPDETIPTTGVDFVIIVGSNEATQQ